MLARPKPDMTLYQFFIVALLVQLSHIFQPRQKVKKKHNTLPIALIKMKLGI